MRVQFRISTLTEILSKLQKPQCEGIFKCPSKCKCLIHTVSYLLTARVLVYTAGSANETKLFYF